MEKKGRILTGHRATGPRHIGHLVGTLNTWVSLQDSYECFFLVADLHVLTTDYANPEKIRRNTIEILADWLAVGIDPARSTLVLQSAIPEHALLSLLLSMLAPVGRLERIPTYKEQIQQLHLSPSLGLLTYPVLQASDILIYQANLVPVGEDQLPHLEVTREIARRFNFLYGEVFPEPAALLTETSITTMGVGVYAARCDVRDPKAGAKLEKVYKGESELKAAVDMVRTRASIDPRKLGDESLDLRSLSGARA